jgi:hypothetical protein
MPAKRAMALWDYVNGDDTGGISWRALLALQHLPHASPTSSPQRALPNSP